MLEKLTEEEYYDFQFSRPKILRNQGHREIIWPSTTILRAEQPGVGFELLFVHGVEPSFRWQSYTADLLTKAAEYDVDAVVLMGALLADVPHTRPIPASFSAEDETLQEAIDVDSPPMRGLLESWGSSPTPHTRQASRRSPSGLRFLTMWAKPLAEGSAGADAEA